MENKIQSINQYFGQVLVRSIYGTYYFFGTSPFVFFFFLASEDEYYNSIQITLK